MLLGVILFFDGGLLAIGNVKDTHTLMESLVALFFFFNWNLIDSLLGRLNLCYWIPKNIGVLFKVQ